MVETSPRLDPREESSAESLDKDPPFDDQDSEPNLASCTATTWHHWLLTEAFHEALWYILRYAGPALPMSDIGAWRCLLQIVLRGRQAKEARDNREKEDKSLQMAPVHDPDAVELLLRLALRKPHGFTVPLVERQYGDRLRIHEALRTLEATPVQWWTEEERSDASLAKRAPHLSATHTPHESPVQCPSMKRPRSHCAAMVPSIRRYRGVDVARLLASMKPAMSHSPKKEGAAVDVKKDNAAPCDVETHAGPVQARSAEQELLAILRAARATDLRSCALLLYKVYHSVTPRQAGGFHLTTGDGEKSLPPPKDKKGDTSTVPSPVFEETNAESDEAEVTTGVPNRKRDLILFLLQRGYRCPAAGPEVTPEGEHLLLLAQCWDHCIGDVITVHTAVKYSARTAAELFHAFFGNLGAGGALSSLVQRNSVTGALYAATAPTLLMTRPQLQLLSRRRRLKAAAVLKQGGGADDDAHTCRHRSLLMQNLPPWLLASQQQGSADLTGTPPRSLAHEENFLFQSPSELALYREALHHHQQVFRMGEGATTIADRIRGRNLQYVLQAYEKAIAALQHSNQQLQKHSSVPAKAEPRSMLHTMLRERGVCAFHLLQFTARYRWYACLENLYPLLQTLRRYDEANRCLEVLLREPLYRLRPQQSSPPSATPSSVFLDVLYRPHKRGEWLTRLAQNLCQTNRKDQSLALLLDAHEAWYSSWQTPAAEKEALHMVFCMMAATPEDAVGSGRCSRYHPAWTAVDITRLPAAVQRRSRLLRALWPERNATTSPPLALIHAVYEYQTIHFCRRSDRLTMEGMLRRLHRIQRRWTPVPARLSTFTDSLVEVPEEQVLGERNVLDSFRWQESISATSCECPAVSSSSVEEFVLGRQLHVLNHDKVGEKPERRMTDVEGATLKNEEEEEACRKYPQPTAGPWRGVHCEGSWIAYTARAILWDCYYYHYPVGSMDGSHDTSGDIIDPDRLWLAPFQEGPLDLLSPLHFATRRRHLVEDRLFYFESQPKMVMLEYIGKRVRGRPETYDSLSEKKGAKGLTLHSPGTSDEHPDAAAAPEGTADDTAPVPDGASEGVSSSTSPLLVSPVSLTMAGLSVEREESMVSLHSQAMAVDQPNTTKDICGAPDDHEVPEYLKVDVGTLPLLNILAAVPQDALFRLLRKLYLSPMHEGHTVSFSGFPDLVLWHSEVDSLSNVYSAASFRLIEVKSPNDVLSTKQMAVNDCLRQCGFDVRVVRVVDVNREKGKVNKTR